VVLAALLAVAPATAAQGPAVRTIAVADFVDDSTDGGVIGASRLNAVLGRLVADRGGDRVRVVATEAVRAAMQAQGVLAPDLVSPTRAVALAQAVGADWIVTGRWLHLDVDIFTVPSRADPTVEVPVSVVGGSLLEIRVLEAATRRVVLRDSLGGESRGFSPFWALRRAAQVALQRAADRILRL